VDLQLLLPRPSECGLCQQRCDTMPAQLRRHKGMIKIDGTMAIDLQQPVIQPRFGLPGLIEKTTLLRSVFYLHFIAPVMYSFCSWRQTNFAHDNAIN